MSDTNPSGDGMFRITPEMTAAERIMHAAFAAFTENGYAKTTTQEIARRAKVSKRELYAWFGSKQAMWVACNSGRKPRLRPEGELPAPRDKTMLAQILTVVTTTLIREVSHPEVLATFRLALAEWASSPEIARTLEAEGRQPAIALVAGIMQQACAAGLLEPGDPESFAMDFLTLAWRDMLVCLLMGVMPPLTEDDIAARVAAAVEAFLKLRGL